MSMKSQITVAACFGAALCFAGAVGAHAEDSTVTIKLEDASMNGGTTSGNMADMKMVLDRSTIHAGKVTLRATNESKSMIHEVIVVRDTGGLLPYAEDAGKLVESQINPKPLGEVSDLDPGKTGEKSFDLTPGNYLLICNQPQHFMRGMWARLKVVADTAAVSGAGNPSTLRPAVKQVQMPAGEDAEGS